MAASSDEPEVMKATRSLDNSEVHSFFFLFLVTKSYSLFMNIILCCWHVSWHLLTDMVVMLTNIKHYFKWGLVNICLDSRPICSHKGAFSSQDPRNLWLIMPCLFSGKLRFNSIHLIEVCVLYYIWKNESDKYMPKHIKVISHAEGH